MSKLAIFLMVFGLTVIGCAPLPAHNSGQYDPNSPKVSQGHMEWLDAKARYADQLNLGVKYGQECRSSPQKQAGGCQASVNDLVAAVELGEDVLKDGNDALALGNADDLETATENMNDLVSEMRSIIRNGE